MIIASLIDSFEQGWAFVPAQELVSRSREQLAPRDFDLARQPIHPLDQRFLHRDRGLAPLAIDENSNRVLPAQARETGEPTIAGTEGEIVFNGESCEVRIWNRV
jgi:hypothetical protein